MRCILAQKGWPLSLRERSVTIYNDKCLGTLKFGQWTLWDQLHLQIVRLEPDFLIVVMWLFKHQYKTLFTG